VLSDEQGPENVTVTWRRSAVSRAITVAVASAGVGFSEQLSAITQLGGGAQNSSAVARRLNSDFF